MQANCYWPWGNCKKSEFVGSNIYLSTMCNSANTTAKPCEEVNMNQNLIHNLRTINIQFGIILYRLILYQQ